MKSKKVTIQIELDQLNSDKHDTTLALIETNVKSFLHDINGGYFVKTPGTLTYPGNCETVTLITFTVSDRIDDEELGALASMVKKLTRQEAVYLSITPETAYFVS